MSITQRPLPEFLPQSQDMFDNMAEQIDEFIDKVRRQIETLEGVPVSIEIEIWCKRRGDNDGQK